jgi:hypothetical protein
MPTQTQVAQGLVGCEAIRIDYSPAVTPTNAAPLDDDDGRYLLIERTDPSAPVRIVLQYTAPNEPYDSHRAQWQVNGYEEVFEVNPDPSVGGNIIVQNPFGYPVSLFNSGRYKRYEPLSNSYSGDYYYSQTTTRRVFREVSYMDYDENWQEITVTEERYSFDVGMSSESGSGYDGESGIEFLRTVSNATGLSLRTGDGRAIDWETAAVSPGWAIIVYEIFDWGESEINRLDFDANPSPVSADCLGREGCEPQCVEIYRESDGAYTCICKETAEPTLAPTQNRIVPKREKAPYVPPLDPPIKVTAAANARKLRKLKPTVKRAQEEYDSAATQVDADPSESNLQAATLALNRLQAAKREESDLESAIAATTTESERESGITVIPSRASTQEWKTPNLAPNRVQQVQWKEPTLIPNNEYRADWRYPDVVPNRVQQTQFQPPTLVPNNVTQARWQSPNLTPNKVNGVVEIGNTNAIESEPVGE